MHFEYELKGKISFFTDVLYQNKPCIFSKPRNHESLFYVTDGDLLYQKDGKKEIVPNGTVGYIARGSLDKTSPYNCDSVSYIAVNFNFTDSDFTPTLQLDTLCAQSSTYFKLFESAFLHQALKKPASEVICKGILLQIIGLLHNEKFVSNKEMERQRKMEPAMRCIAENYGDADFKIADLSILCNMSDKHFRNIFCGLYGKTPYAYLQDFRLEQAKALLAGTEKSVSEIAIQCGFSDVYSFSHSFKRKYNFSPRKYRYSNFPHLF